MKIVYPDDLTVIKLPHWPSAIVPFVMLPTDNGRRVVVHMQPEPANLLDSIINSVPSPLQNLENYQSLPFCKRGDFGFWETRMVGIKMQTRLAPDIEGGDVILVVVRKPILMVGVFAESNEAAMNFLRYPSHDLLNAIAHYDPSEQVIVKCPEVIHAR